jgi:uncharacterized protein YoxC
MKNKQLTPELKIDNEGINVINSFNELTAENQEVIDSLEALRNQSSMIRSCYADMLSKTNKLLESMNELMLLAR